MTERSEQRDGVVVACRRRDGRWLMVRRAASLQRAPGMVGFPGGEVEDGEAQRDAVVREMREELGLDVKPLRCFWRSQRVIRGFLLHGWLAELVSDPDTANPDPAEVTELLWLNEREGIDHPDGLPANRPFIETLREAVSHPPADTPSAQASLDRSLDGEGHQH